LSHLRLGWAIGPPEVISRAMRLNDNLGVVHPWITEAIGARILTDSERMDRWRTRARARVDANRAAVARLLDGDPRFDGALPPHGILAFIRWRGDSRFPDAETLCRRAMEEARVCLVPGRFFQRRDFIRIAAGAPEEDVAAACEALASYLRRD
jgi:aspartate/methionine/tyrosine aminotransferase